MTTDQIQRFPEGRALEASRYCTYKQLMGAVQRAKAANYNRQLPAKVVRRLDPQGTNTFTFVMVHEHIDGVEVDHPHVRAYAYIKVRGSRDAYEQHLDIPLVCWRNWKTGDER
jgi:hypothetical protein